MDKKGLTTKQSRIFELIRTHQPIKGKDVATLLYGQEPANRTDKAWAVVRSQMQVLKAKGWIYMDADHRAIAVSEPQKARIEKIDGQNPSGLVGMFFHSVTEDGKLGWQGVITRNPEPGWYVVQTFDYLVGAKHWEQNLVKIEDMVGWLFYDDAEAMKEGFEYGTASGKRGDLGRPQ